MVMLGIRSAWRTELDCAPCELVFGTTLAVPGSFFGEEVKREELPTNDFVDGLRRAMNELKPTQMSHHAEPKVSIPESLEKTEFVFIRTDAVRPPLVRPYTGPFKVLEKSDKFFTVLKGGKPDKIAIDRLKPAFMQQQTQKTDDVMPRAESSKYGVSTEPAVPGQKRARGRPRKGEKGCVKRKSESKTPAVIRDTSEVFTRYGRRSRRPRRS